jgi:hypothetical protein
MAGEIAKLVKNAQGEGARAAAAAARLVELGMPVVPHVVEAIRATGDWPSATLLGVIPRIRVKALVPYMLELIGEKETYLPLMAFRALAKSKDSRALAPLLKEFQDETNTKTMRGGAADALGELGDLRAVPALLRAVRDIERRGELKGYPALAVRAVVALARLGNHELARIPISLAVGRDAAARRQAASALKSVVGPGIFEVSKRLLRGRDYELRSEAVDALFYLGLPESIELFISALRAEEEDPDFADKLRDRINDLTGQRFTFATEDEEIRGWWREHQHEFVPLVCHRHGKPIEVRKLVSLLKTKERGWRYWLFEELRIITGEDFGLVPEIEAERQADAVARAEAWARKQGGKFEAGALYKYGFRQSLPEVFKRPARGPKGGASSAKKKAAKKKAAGKKRTKK